MPEDWSKLEDIDPLADGRVSIDFDIPLSAFPRLAPQLAGTAGSARGRVRFSRASGLPTADVQVAADVGLTCQRCLAPLAWHVDSHASTAMIADAAEADRAPADLETILAPEHRLSIRDLVEEELLLSLPIVPLHAQAECAAAAAQAMPAEPAAQGQRPFAQLDELLKRTQRRE
jgi:uncharacterized protein